MRASSTICKPHLEETTLWRADGPGHAIHRAEGLGSSPAVLDQILTTWSALNDRHAVRVIGQGDHEALDDEAARGDPPDAAARCPPVADGCWERLSIS
jgi:hypothetical protein